jgi:hypothetical protein
MGETPNGYRRRKLEEIFAKKYKAKVEAEEAKAGNK